MYLTGMLLVKEFCSFIYILIQIFGKDVKTPLSKQ